MNHELRRAKPTQGGVFRDSSSPFYLNFLEIHAIFTLPVCVARKQHLLEDIFANDNSPLISLTTQSYAISAILEVIGVPHFRVSEEAIIPLFVKAVKVGEGE